MVNQATHEWVFVNRKTRRLFLTIGYIWGWNAFERRNEAVSIYWSLGVTLCFTQIVVKERNVRKGIWTFRR